MPKRKHVISSDSDGSDDDNFEEELLSLAGPIKKSKHVKKESSSDSDTSDDDDDWTLGGNGAQVKGKAGGKKLKRGQDSKKKSFVNFSSDDETGRGLDNYEAGQSGSSGGESGGSGSEEGEGSDNEDDSDQPIMYDDGLDENLVGDLKDQARLSQMTEAEREAEMYERFTKREAMKTRFEIQQKLRRERKMEKKKKLSKKTKVGKPLREKDKVKTSRAKAIEELQAKRAAEKKKKEIPYKELFQVGDIFSSGSEEGDKEENAEEDWDEEAGQQTVASLKAAAPKIISSSEELTKMKLSRFRMEKWVHMPFFKKVAVGSFVRVGIGNHEGRPVYRIAEVTDVADTPKVYNLGATRTNKGLKLRHGRQERIFRMEYVSNSNFTESEFRKWKEEMEKLDLRLPTEEDAKKKVKDFHEARNFEFTDDLVDTIVSEKSKFRKKPVNYAMAKNRLIMEKAHAEEVGDMKRLEEIKQDLEDLEERAEALDKQRSRGLSAISFINERNRQKNVIHAEQALKEETAGNERKDDPFTRRKCTPTLVAVTRGGLAESSFETPLKATQTEPKRDMKPPIDQSDSSMDTLTSLQPVDQLLSTPAPSDAKKKSSQSTDLFSAHDFDIHIDLPSSNATVTVRTNSKEPSHTLSDSQPRRSLNLADYKKRRGLI